MNNWSKLRCVACWYAAELAISVLPRGMPKVKLSLLVAQQDILYAMSGDTTSDARVFVNEAWEKITKAGEAAILAEAERLKAELR